MSAFERALKALPRGTFTGTAGGKSYVITTSRMTGGRAIKLVAEERGGPDYISLNWYDVGPGLLKPCEMPADKVTRFVLTLVPDAGARYCGVKRSSA